MVTRLIAAAAATALLLATASAQSPTPGQSTGAGDDNTAVATLKEQSSDQWLASKLIGTAIYNSANEKVATINDLLLDKNGTPIAVVINAGGFLGIGGKKVAVDLKSLQLVRSENGNEKAIASMTKEQFQQAAEFKPYVPPRPEPPVAANRGPLPLGAPGAPR
jgi:sporulation protein YlmC with PRC-barrel domain